MLPVSAEILLLSPAHCLVFCKFTSRLGDKPHRLAPSILSDQATVKEKRQAWSVLVPEASVGAR